MRPDAKASQHRVPITFLSPKTQFENVGDALINRELIRLISTQSDVVVDLSRCPPQFRKNLILDNDINILYCFGFWPLFFTAFSSFAAGRTRYYFLSPGGYVGDRKGLAYLSGLLNTSVLLLMRILGMRICHVGVSYERLGKGQASLLRLRNRLLHRHVVRDHDSLIYAQSLGMVVDGEMLDLAFGAALDQAAAATGDRSIAISARADQDPDAEAQLVELIQQMDARLSSNIPFRFICQVQRDERLLKTLSSLVVNRPVSFANVHENIQECFSAYDGCSYVLSNRLHALLMGGLRGAKPIGLLKKQYNEKIYGVFSSVDLAKNVVTLGPETSKIVVPLIQNDHGEHLDFQSKTGKLLETFSRIFQK